VFFHEQFGRLHEIPPSMVTLALPNGLELHPPLRAGKGAARRLRLGTFILWQAGRQLSATFPPASRVSISELLASTTSGA